MAVVISAVNHVEDALLISSSESTDEENLGTIFTDISAAFAGTDTATIYVSFTVAVSLTSVDMHEHDIPAGATWEVDFYDSTVQQPSTLIEGTGTMNVHATYTAESELPETDGLAHSIYTKTTTGTGTVLASPITGVRSILITINVSGAFSYSIGMLGAYTGTNLAGSVLDGQGTTTAVETMAGRATETFNAGVAQTDSTNTERYSFNMAAMSAADANSLEHLSRQASTTWPVFIHFRPGQTTHKDRASEGGVFRFVAPISTAALGAHSGTSADKYIARDIQIKRWR